MFFGTKGAVELLAPEATVYPLSAGEQPTVSSTKAEDQQGAHIDSLLCVNPKRGEASGRHNNRRNSRAHLHYRK